MSGRVPTETQECRAFVDWTKVVHYAGEPLFDRVVKVANERGKAGPMTAIMTAIGMRPGFPDYLILIPAGPFAGLLLEAKRIRGRVDADQIRWVERLVRFGYHAEICEGADALIAATRRYLNFHADPALWVDRTSIVA